MLQQSQPLDSMFCEKLGLDKDRDELQFSEKMIKKQRIRKMFDDLLDDSEKRKITISLRIEWLWRDITTVFYNIKYSIRNHFKWRKTIRKLRPWEGFSGLILVMQTHLKDYIETEEKYGHSEENYRMNKIATAKEVLELLERMKYPSEYSHKRREEVDARYPDYKYLNTEYESGGSCHSGEFVAQGNGWAGKESGSDPREGYFEFVDGRLTLVESPDKSETDRVLAEIERYSVEVRDAYKQAELDSDRDFDRLGELLKENFYSWWD